MPSVAANQKRDRPVRTRPLSGIGVGRTTSKAREPVADATSSRRSRPSVEQVAHLARPDEGAAARCAQRAASPVRPWDSQAIEAGDDLGGTLRRKSASSKQAASARADRRAATSGSAASSSRSWRRSSAARSESRWTMAYASSRDSPPCSTSASRTRLLAVQAQPALDVLAHPLRPDDQPLDQAARLAPACSRAGSWRRAAAPARAEVADVALVPERLVLQRRVRRSRAAGGPGRRSARTGSGCACGASPSCPSGRPGTAPSARRSRCAGGCGPPSRSARGSRR